LDALEHVEVPGRDAWHLWLKRNHTTSPGVWLSVFKKNAPAGMLRYEEAVEEALVFGWIDSTVRRFDEVRFIQLFTPRKPGSTWSPSNKGRVERLMAEGRMQPPGLAAVEVAKRNGSWEQLDEAEALTVPEDFERALASDPTAEANFAAFSESRKKMTLFWISSAKRAETRSRRVDEAVRLAAKNKIYGE
jgi:uncharacterized protein YdeI (YjbR/CyaY-like superfamily)